jgi:hypothetical protein
MAMSMPPDTEGRRLKPEVGLVIAVSIALVVFALVGVRASRVAASRGQEVVRAEATLATFADLRRRYTPAVAAESIAWRRAWLQVRELGAGSSDRLSLTQRLTRSAEDAGLSGVRVLIGPPDTVGVPPRFSTEGVQSKAAEFSLRVEGSGRLESVIAFLGQLPPSVSPTRLSLVRQDGRGPHRISLAVYEITFTNGAPHGWSSMDGGGSGSNRTGRPGG